MPTPKVDDQYLFDHSLDVVKQAHSVRDAAAGKIQSLVTWLWSIYTTLAAVGFALAGKQLDLWATVIIASGSAALIGVYWGTVWIQAPVPMDFDPRSPTQIRDAYSAAIARKSRRLNGVLFASLVASAVVSAGLMVASLPMAAKAQPSLTALLQSSGSRTLVQATASGLEGVTKAQLRVVAMGAQGFLQSKDSELPLPKEGALHTSVEVDSATTEADVIVSWEEKGATRLLGQRLKRTPEKAKTP